MRGIDASMILITLQMYIFLMYITCWFVETKNKTKRCYQSTFITLVGILSVDSSLYTRRQVRFGQENSERGSVHYGGPKTHESMVTHASKDSHMSRFENVQKG